MMYDLSIDNLWSRYGDELKSLVKVKHLRKFKLKEHQQIIDNYCKFSKSKVKYRNIHIYDYIILRKHKNYEAQKEFQLASCSLVIQKIIDKGFYKDLLNYWNFEETNRGFSCQFKKI